MKYEETKLKVLELIKESKLNNNETLLLAKEIEVMVFKEKIETEELNNAFEKEMLKK